MLAIRLPQDVEDRLGALAEATGRTKTYYAREAIVEYLDYMESEYLSEESERARITRQIEEGIRDADAGNFVSAEEMEARFAEIEEKLTRMIAERESKK
jgi:RHH-type rel operon transcriptional repressor/antitoxin RelB